MNLSAAASGLALIGFALATPLRAQEMTAPSFVVGDRWTYRESDLLTKNETAQITETVTAAGAGEYWIDARRASRTWWRGDAARSVHREQFAFSEGAPDQRGKIIASNDAGCAYPWPLKVGTKFECTENVVASNGWKLRYDMKFAVEGAETVETAAGRFETLRLVGKGFVNNETTNAIGSRQERVIWLAPAVKREVRQEIRTVLKSGQIFRSEGRELTAFKTGAS